MEGLKITGSSTAGNRMRGGTSDLDEQIANVKKEIPGKPDTIPDLSSQKVDLDKGEADLNNTANSNPDLNRSTAKESEDAGNNPKHQGRCKPKATESLRVIINDPDLQAYRDHMSVHAVICKFMGFWPSEKSLCQWIKRIWKPKGDVQLHLGAKGFFLVVFANLEDKDQIFEGGPYIYASAGLYMKP